MTDNILADRKRALEEEYFRNANTALIERLRASREQDEARQALQDVSGIADPEVLDSLLGAGIDAAALSAIEIIPLVAVAWADGTLDDDERKAVLRVAAGLGLKEGSSGHTLLDDWLAEAPPESLFQTWDGYVKELGKGLAPALRTTLYAETVKRARAVAEARGGFLGLVGAKISAEERAVLDAVETAFTG